MGEGEVQAPKSRAEGHPVDVRGEGQHGVGGDEDAEADEQEAVAADAVGEYADGIGAEGVNEAEDHQHQRHEAWR